MFEKKSCELSLFGGKDGVVRLPDWFFRAWQLHGLLRQRGVGELDSGLQSYQEDVRIKLK